MLKRASVFTCIFFFIVAFIGLLFAARVFAQETTPCKAADQVERMLSSQFNEERVSVAATSEGKLLERWESTGGSWTLLLRIKRDVLCLVASGMNWRELPRGQAVGELS